MDASHHEHQSHPSPHHPAAAIDDHGGTLGDHAAHDRHEGHSVAMFRDRFWLSLLLTIPVLVWSPDLQEWLGYEAPSFPGSDLVPAHPGDDRLPVRRQGLPAVVPSPSCATGSPG